jgi:hypothetical protein
VSTNETEGERLLRWSEELDTVRRDLEHASNGVYARRVDVTDAEAKLRQSQALLAAAERTVTDLERREEMLAILLGEEPSG